MPWPQRAPSRAASGAVQKRIISLRMANSREVTLYDEAI